MNQQYEDLKAQVAANKSVMASAVALIQGLKAAVDQAIADNDPAKLKALSDSLAADDVQLANAIMANTPPTA